MRPAAAKTSARLANCQTSPPTHEASTTTNTHVSFSVPAAAQLFGTFTAWDLDAVFTSDHEWCQYATLDGIAIHHLHPPSGDEPVTSTRFTWDGRRRKIDPSAA